MLFKLQKHLIFITLVLFFPFSLLAEDNFLIESAERINCENAAIPSACGKVGQRKIPTFAKRLVNMQNRFSEGKSLDQVFKKLNLPDTPESDEKIKSFLEESNKVMEEHRTKLEKIYKETLSLTENSGAAKNSARLLALNREALQTHRSLLDGLTEIEVKNFGKIDLAKVHHSPAQVYSSYLSDDVRYKYRKLGAHLDGPINTEAHISRQKKLYDSVMKMVRQKGFKWTKLGGGVVLGGLSLATMAGNTKHSTSLVLACAKQLDVKLSAEDIFQISRYTYSLNGLRTNSDDCNETRFEQNTIETLKQADFLTPAAKEFFEKFSTVIAKRQDQIFSLPKLEFKCNGYSWEGNEVTVSDSKIAVKTTMEKRTLTTEISWNSVEEWDYSTLKSDDRDYQDYLNVNVRSLTPTSATGRAPQKRQMSTRVACNRELVGFYDRARCEAARAMELWNQFADVHTQLCQDEDKSVKNKIQNSNSNTTDVEFKK